MLPTLLGLALLCGQPAADSTALINRALSQKWETEKLTQAEKTSDVEFLRRASLDLIGRIPTLEEQEVYLKDPSEKRRRLLIDRLLAHDDYARHWANGWSDWLLAGAGEPKVQAAFHGWLVKHFARNGSHKELAEKIITATGSTRDTPAGHFLAVHRGAAQPKKKWDKLGQYDMIPATSQLFRVLHAKRIQCVHCHDHPFGDDLRQDQFWSMNALFRQVRFNPTKGGLELDDDPSLNKPGYIPHERRNGLRIYTLPSFYDAKQWKPTSKQTRREYLAEHFVKHPDFARGHVNFLWARIFGHGLTQSADFDDMGSHNPVVHEKVMDRLAADFVKSGHDAKAFLRWLCTTDLYNLKSVANKSNAGADKAVFFSRMQVRPLSRRQLVESLVVALTMEDYATRRDALRAELLREIPPPNPLPLMQECEIGPLEAEARLSIQQALWLMHGNVLQRELVSPKGTVAKAIKKHGATPKGIPGVATDLFRITLCRPPTPQELQRVSDPKIYEFRIKGGMSEQQAIRELCQDIFWALVNTSEFGLNH